MKHYLFVDEKTGEEFIVGANNIDKAYGEALNWFVNPTYLCELTDDEAEASGLDEY